MKPFFKSKVAIALFLLITSGIYGCGRGPKTGAADAPDTTTPNDSAKMVAIVKSPSISKRHDTVKKAHKLKPDTLTVITDTAKPVAPSVKTDTAKKVTIDITHAVKIPNTGIAINNVHHFIMRRLPASPALDRTRQGVCADTDTYYST